MTEAAIPEPSPEQAALFARVRRMMLIAGLTTAVAVGAVLIAIVYRIATIPTTALPVPGALVRAATSILPAGARLVGTSSDAGRIVLTYEHAGGTTLITVDPRNLAITGRLDLKPE